MEAFRDEDDGNNMSLLLTWVSDRAPLRQIVVETPTRLYGFKTEA